MLLIRSDGRKKWCGKKHWKEVIKKALVELDGAPFKYFEAHREEWAVDTCFQYPGAIQYYGPTEVCDITTVTLALEQAK